MKVAAHFEKIGRLEALRRRLDRVEDFEIWFWATMNAGTNAINAALHATDITEDGPWYPQQPSVYMVPGAKPGEWVHAFKPLGDVLHVGRPKIEKPLPESVQKMAHLMEEIEEWRDACVRDGHPVTPEILEKIERAYAGLMAIGKTFAPQGS